MAPSFRMRTSAAELTSIAPAMTTAVRIAFVSVIMLLP